MSNTKKINVSLLVMDYEVYPRHKISDSHVNELVQAIEAGIILDPVIWDRKTKTIIDGFHRISAYKKINDLNYEIEGYEIDCEDKADMIVKSIRYNNKHGLRLSAWDKARCIYLARAYKIKENVIKEALAIPNERYEKLKKRIVPVKNNIGKVVRQTQLKNGQKKIAQKEDGVYVTEKEATEIEGNCTTGLRINSRLKTLARDIDLGNFEVTEQNIELIKEFIQLLDKAVEDYENGE